MRFAWVVFMVGCGGRSGLNPDDAFDTGLPSGFPECIELGPKLIRVDADMPTNTAIVTGDCGYNQPITVVLDDPSEVFQVDPSNGLAGIDDVVLTVTLLEAEPGEYQAQLGVKVEELVTWVELRGTVLAE
ncbi:MAG: hypothetical protein AB8H79_09650 [Myxococcota bacterium]